MTLPALLHTYSDGACRWQRDNVQATYLSASDVVAALTALLEQPLSVRDDATPRDRFWCVCMATQLCWHSHAGAAHTSVGSPVAEEAAAARDRAVRRDARAAWSLQAQAVNHTDAISCADVQAGVGGPGAEGRRQAACRAGPGQEAAARHCAVRSHLPPCSPCGVMQEACNCGIDATHTHVSRGQVIFDGALVHVPE